MWTGIKIGQKSKNIFHLHALSSALPIFLFFSPISSINSAHIYNRRQFSSFPSPFNSISQQQQTDWPLGQTISVFLFFPICYSCRRRRRCRQVAKTSTNITSTKAAAAAAVWRALHCNAFVHSFTLVFTFILSFSH